MYSFNIWQFQKKPVYQCRHIIISIQNGVSNLTSVGVVLVCLVVSEFSYNVSAAYIFTLGTSFFDVASANFYSVLSSSDPNSFHLFSLFYGTHVLACFS